MASGIKYMKQRDFIKEYLLPNETAEFQHQWRTGGVGYDVDYIMEVLSDVNKNSKFKIELILDGAKIPRKTKRFIWTEDKVKLFVKVYALNMGNSRDVDDNIFMYSNYKGKTIDDKIYQFKKDYSLLIKKR